MVISCSAFGIATLEDGELKLLKLLSIKSKLSPLQKRKSDAMKKFILFCCLVFAANSYAADSGYHVIKRLKVGGEGGWDYLTIDEAARRLYISRSTHVMVIDLVTDQVVGDIPNTPGV